MNLTKKEKYEFIKGHRDTKMPYKVIGGLLGVSKQAVQNYCIRYGIEKPKTEVIKLTYSEKRIKYLKDNIKIVDTCWEFQRCLDKCGYSKVSYKGKANFGHRVSYELFNGRIPEGMCVCHTCDNRRCINPNHLWLGTQTENIQDRENKKSQSQSMLPTCN